MMLKGLDEDWSKVDPAQAWADGYRFVVGYVSQDNTGKNFTVTDVSRLRETGFAVGFVYEYAPNSALGGYQQGVTDASIAISHAQSLGVPTGVALYTAVDFNPTPTQLPLVLAYATGFLAVCATHGYRSGVYGGLATVSYLQSHNYGGFLWQTYAWSGTPPVWLAGVALRQVLNGVHEAGATVDNDVSMLDDFGQWKVDMAGVDEQSESYQALIWKVDALVNLTDTFGGGPFVGQEVPFTKAFKALAGAVVGSGSGLSATDAATLQGFTDAVNALVSRLK